MCYVKFQNIFANVLVYLLEHLSFWLRCRSFLLWKFASQLKLIQSAVRVRILGICVTSSILRVLLPGSWVSGSQFPSPRDPFPGSRLWSSSVLSVKAPSPRIPGLRVLGSQVFESQVLMLDYSSCDGIQCFSNGSIKQISTEFFFKWRFTVLKHSMRDSIKKTFARLIWKLSHKKV